MSEKKYCIHCGKENEIDSTVCCQCNEEFNQKENLLIEYLISKAKDEFKGTITDNIFEAIKKYLLSHLYGALVTVSIVSYAVVSTGVVDEVIAKEYKHIEPVTKEPIVFTEEYDESSYVYDFVTEYVLYHVNQDVNQSKISSMEANNRKYMTNIAFALPEVAEYQFGYPAIEAEPISDVAFNLKQENKKYAQMSLSLVSTTGEITNCLFTLVKDNNSWYVVEAVSNTEVEIVSDYDMARSVVHNYRNNSVFIGYEDEAAGDYATLISCRAPSGYGYNSYEFSMQRFPEGANGCLDVNLEASELSPSNTRSKVGSSLKANDIPFMEFVLTEEIYGIIEGEEELGIQYMCHRSWLITTAKLDGVWYVVEDQFLQDEKR